MSGIVAQNTLDNTGLIKSPAGGGAWNFIKNITITSSTATASFVNGTSDVVSGQHIQNLCVYDN